MSCEQTHVRIIINYEGVDIESFREDWAKIIIKITLIKVVKW